MSSQDRTGHHTMTTHSFSATVELHRKTATGVEVPTEVIDLLDRGKRPPVSVTINGHTYRSTVGVMDGRFLISISAEQRAATGVNAGDVITVQLAVDDAPRTVEVPADLQQALDAAPTARASFEALSNSGKKRHVLSVEGAKTDETRQRRIQKVVDELG